MPMRLTAALLGLGCLLASTLSAEDRALLVGLDRYGHPEVSPTPGGVDDARSVARTIEQAFGFSSDSIRILADEQATSAAILENFQHWLIDGTEPGDRVFFLYAGHGSQLADQNGDEDDGFDETLAPFDTNPRTGENQIRDDVIDALIAQLSGRRSVLLFDSCHSGTLTRSLGGGPSAGVRYLPRPDQIQAMSRRRSAGGSYGVEAVAGGDQAVFDAPSAMARMSGVIAISAAGPGQLAYPLEVAGKHRGALSYLFEQAVIGSSRSLFGGLTNQVLSSAEKTAKKTANAAVLDGLSGDLADASLQDLQQGVSVATLESMIDKGMQQLQSSGQLPGNQRPWFEVLSEQPIEEQPLYGGWEQEAAAAISHPIDDRQVSLRALKDQVLFRPGDHLTLEVETDRPGFLYLLVFSEQEKATCIFPNPLDRNHRVAAGSIQIPTHDRYRLPVREPYGRDVVVALVSDEELRLCDRLDYSWDEVFDRVELDEVHKRLRSEARRRGFGVEEVAPSGSGQPASQASAPAAGAGAPAWQTAVMVVHTLEGESP